MTRPPQPRRAQAPQKTTPATNNKGKKQVQDDDDDEDDIYAANERMKQAAIRFQTNSGASKVTTNRQSNSKARAGSKNARRVEKQYK